MCPVSPFLVFVRHVHELLSTSPPPPFSLLGCPTLLCLSSIERACSDAVCDRAVACGEDALATCICGIVVPVLSNPVVLVLGT